MSGNIFFLTTQKTPAANYDQKIDAKWRIFPLSVILSSYQGFFTTNTVKEYKGLITGEFCVESV
jgi:hypothetical protein